MNRIIDSNPAAYPQTNTSEIKAVTTFESILDIERVKADVKVLDKIPNVDGTLELVNTQQIPIGELKVQIKALEKKNYQNPKYQCQKDFLAYCENSILPVLLIVVNTESSIAYWHHIDKSTLLALSKKIKGGKESVNLDFDKDNFIQKNSNSYIDKWIEIIGNYQNKLYDYDLIKKRNEEINLELSEIKKTTNISIGKTDPIFKEIHTFLDYYNGLLDGDFTTIKNILYPNYWKIGCGVYGYLDNSAQFSLYPIAYDLNDVLIKQYNSQDEFYLQKVFSYFGFNLENPIKKRPKNYAYELIERNTKQVLKRQPFLIKDQFLANEYILAFIDKYHTILGLDFSKLEYSISEIEFSFNTFLPLWIEQTINKSEYKDKREPSIFVIDYIFFHTYLDDIIKISEKVTEEISKGRKPSINIKISSTDFNIHILLNLIAYLRQVGVLTIIREYETRHKVNKSSYYIWEAWGEEKTVKNIKVFYNHFIRIYDLLIKTYFPNLQKELQFYNDYNLLVIVVDFSRVAISYSHTPSIEYYYLKTLSDVDNKIVIYNSTEDGIPLKRENIRDYFNNDFVIDGNAYRLIRSRYSILDFIYEKTPILNSINNLLKEQLEKYFEDKKNDR